MERAGDQSSEEGNQGLVVPAWRSKFLCLCSLASHLASQPMDDNGKENLLAIMALTMVAAATAAVSGVSDSCCGRKATRSLLVSTEPFIKGKTKNMGRAWQDLDEAGHDRMAEGVHH